MFIQHTEHLYVLTDHTSQACTDLAPQVKWNGLDYSKVAAKAAIDRDWVMVGSTLSARRATEFPQLLLPLEGGVRALRFY